MSNISALKFRKYDSPTWQQVDEQTLRLQFGASCLELHKDGHMVLRNNKSSISLTGEGVVQVSGKQVIQTSDDDIKFNAGKDIFLNSA